MVKSSNGLSHIYEMIAAEFEDTLLKSFQITKTINHDFHDRLKKYEERATAIRGNKLFLEMQAQLDLPDFDPLEMGFILFPIYDEDSLLVLLNDPEIRKDEVLKTFALFSYKFFNLYNINVT